MLIGNTIHGAGGSGIKLINTPLVGTPAQSTLTAINNTITNSAAWAVDLDPAVMGESYGTNFLNNHYHGNTSGVYSVAGYAGEGDVAMAQ